MVGKSLKRIAVYFTAPHRVSVREEPVSLPAKGQVLVKTLVSAISAGTELLVYRGLAPTENAVDVSIPALPGRFTFPIKYGYAAVGKVVRLGEDVDPKWQGQMVFGFNPHESLFLSSPEDLMAVPFDLSPEEASLLPSMETAVNFLMDGQPLIGEQVVVFGQGIVGLLTTALLAKIPLEKLVTLDRHDRRRTESLRLGAGHVLNPDSADWPSLLDSLLRKEPFYHGSDLTYELSGNPSALEHAIEATGFNGRIVIGSWYGSNQVGLTLGESFHRSRIRLISSQVSTIAPEWTCRWTKGRRLRTAWRMLHELRPADLITHRFPLSEAAQAFSLIDEHPKETIQIVLTGENDGIEETL